MPRTEQILTQQKPSNAALTQLSSASMMAMVQAMGHVVQNEGQIMESGCKNATLSFAWQGQACENSFNHALNEASSTAKSILCDALGALIGGAILGAGMFAGEKITERMQVGKDYNNTKAQLDSQEKLAKIAGKPDVTSLTAGDATIQPKAPTVDPNSVEAKLIEKRKSELLTHNGAFPCENKGDVEAQFSQKPTKDDPKDYGFDKEKGGYYARGLDEKAIGSMKTDERKGFLGQIHEQYKSTKQVLSSQGNEVATTRQTMQTLISMTSQNLTPGIANAVKSAASSDARIASGKNAVQNTVQQTANENGKNNAQITEAAAQQASRLVDSLGLGAKAQGGK